MPKKNSKPALEVGEPEFKPWDGTKKNFTIKGGIGNKRTRNFKNVPSMVIDLLNKFDGNVSAAARASGTTGNTIMAMITNKTVFDEKRQRIVFEGLHGVPAQRDAEPEGFDEYRKGMAICVVPSKNYDRVRDLVELMKGSVMFKLSTASGWLVVYELKPQDARKFKRFAARDCTKIVCP